MDGILLIDKPHGWTSFDVVAKTRGILKSGGAAKPKVGHTGTLDPMATGLLIIVVGSYCKRAEEFSKLDKTYRADVTLGMTSNTDDEEGEKTPGTDIRPDLAAIQAALDGFTGVQQQVPPLYSAIKINGQRAYKLARKGQETVMEPRTVTIHEITDVTYDYPTVSFTAHVGSGTYIRSLARDLGEVLGTGAYLSGLRRTTVGEYRVDDAVSIEQLTLERISGYLQHVH